MNLWVRGESVQSRHAWRLVAYRWTLPILVLALLYFARLTWGGVTGWFNVAFALVCVGLWVLALRWPAQSVLFTDLAITAIIWTGIAKGAALLFLADGQEALVSFRELLFWTPLITVFWALVFSDGLWVVSILVFALFSAFLSADQLLLHKLGTGLFRELLIPTLLQGAMAFSLASIFAYAMLRTEPSVEDRKRIAREVMTDALTGLPSRAAFDADLSRQSEIARRHLTPLSTAVIQVQALSKINRDFGEDAGQEVMIEIAKLLRGEFSEADLLARWSANAFAVVMPNVELEAARVVVDLGCREISDRVSTLYGPLGLQVAVSSVRADRTADCETSGK